MTDLSHLSKEAKEAYVSIKMEEIRRKNEELKKRHAEIEADKRNAEMNSSKAQSTQVKRVTQGIPPEKPTVVGRISSGRGKRLENLAKEQLKAPEYQQKKQQQRLNEDENPPPDPVFNFLYDRSREGKDTEDRYQRSRRHISNFGGQDFANVKNTMQIRKTQEKDNPPGPPRNKMEMALRMTGRERKEYENWRLEREKIEEDRLARQKTATGEWRREWDKNKLEQDDVEEQQRPQWQSRGRGRGGGGGGGRGHNFRGRGDHHGHHGDMSRPPRWRGQGPSQGPSRGGGSHYGGRRQSSSSQSESERSITTEEILPVEQNVEIDRRVLVDDRSLRISISNDAGIGSAEKPPLTPRSSMTPPRRIGSGRVLSTSSQSEDERSDGRMSNRRGKPYQRGQFSRERGSRPPVHEGPQRSSGKSGRYQKHRRAEDDDTLRPSGRDALHSPIAKANPTPATVEKLEETTVSSGTSESKDEWETGGDESWEDVTTSGNESLELSGPTDDVHTTTIAAEDGEDDEEDNESEDHFQNIEVHLENLSGSNLEPSRRIQCGTEKILNASSPVSVKNTNEPVSSVKDITSEVEKELSGVTHDAGNATVNIANEYDEESDDEDDEEDDEDDYYGEEELRNLEARLENLTASSFISNTQSPQVVPNELLSHDATENLVGTDSVKSAPLTDDKDCLGATKNEDMTESILNSSSDVAASETLIPNESISTSIEDASLADVKEPEDVAKYKSESKDLIASDAVTLEKPLEDERSSTELKDTAGSDIKASEDDVENEDKCKDTAVDSFSDGVNLEASFPSESSPIKASDDATPDRTHENEGSESNLKSSDVIRIPTDDDIQLTSDVCLDSTAEQKERKTGTQSSDVPGDSAVLPLSAGPTTDAMYKQAFEVSDMQIMQGSNSQERQAQDAILITDEVDTFSKDEKNIVNQNKSTTCIAEQLKSLTVNITDECDRTLPINALDVSQRELPKMEGKSAEDISRLSAESKQEGKKGDEEIDQNSDTLPEKSID